MRHIAEALKRKEPETTFRIAFLEIESPNIPDALEHLLSEGADEVIITPYFLHAGRHVLEDVPRLISQAETRYPGRRVELAPHLGFDERIVSVVEGRIKEARGALEKRQTADQN
jgi:sirohydrochlorin ferrochelatase